MSILTIHTTSSEHTSQILVGGHLSEVTSLVPENKRVIAIVDSNVYTHYASQIDVWTKILVDADEKNKTLQTAYSIYEQCIQLEADRDTFLLGIGGGIVCDITGFIAGTFMRGLSFGFVSTTLLSQVDASIGGKNGVNFEGYKNMVGTFRQPEFVICDIHMLETLPQGVFIQGLAEIVKAAAIRDVSLFEYLEQHVDDILKHVPHVLEHLIAESVHIKAQVVEEDEKEKGLRRILNFGHTFAHAIEKTTRTSHGEAVAIGMVAVTKLAVQQGKCDSHSLQRLQQLLSATGLPVTLPSVSTEALQEAFTKDKKKSSDTIHLVLMEQIGKVQVISCPIHILQSSLSDNLC